jgi:hypothetical protein
MSNKCSPSLHSAISVRGCRVMLNLNEEVNDVSATKLRGFFGNLFLDDPEFHHHSEKSYHYPLVQYKRINGQLMVLGFQKYANIVANKLSSIDTVTTTRGNYSVGNKEIILENSMIENVDCRYEFASPWLPLNEQNYADFKSLSSQEQKLFLERILVGNALSCLKGLGVFVNYRITPQLFCFLPLHVRVHGNSFEAFKARFSLNVSLPNFAGLGKSVSKGFGTIRRVA